MKKFFAIVALALLALPAFAQMDNRDFAVSCVTISTNTTAYTLRGELYGVYVDCPANKTGTVTVTTSQGTVFAKSAMTTDAMFYPVVPLNIASTGSAATFTTYGETNTPTSSANAWYGKPALAGTVTAKVEPAAATTGTNTWTITLIYKK